MSQCSKLCITWFPKAPQITFRSIGEGSPVFLWCGCHSAILWLSFRGIDPFNSCYWTSLWVFLHPTFSTSLLRLTETPSLLKRHFNPYSSSTQIPLCRSHFSITTSFHLLTDSIGCFRFRRKAHNICFSCWIDEIFNLILDPCTHPKIVQWKSLGEFIDKLGSKMY